MAKGPNKPAPRRASGEDVVLLCGRTEDGAGLDVIRKRGDVVQRGVVRPLEEGKPITGEVVKLEQRGTTPIFDVTVQYAAGASEESAGSLERSTPARALPGGVTRGHPARVASDEYRRNWDAIWKRSSSKSLPN